MLITLKYLYGTIPSGYKKHTVAVHMNYSSSRPVDVQRLDRDLHCGVYKVSVIQRQNFCEIESL